MLPNPLVIGISGGSGSGKTLLADALCEALRPRHSLTLSQDRYYYSPAGRADEHNFDEPQALDWGLFAAQLAQLCEGRAVELPDYCFVKHQRVGSTRVLPAEILIVEGTLILSQPEVADQLHLSVFIDIDADIRVLRRLVRDLKQRGRSVDSIVEQYLCSVRPMHVRFVAPSRERADIVLTDAGVDEWTRSVLDWLKTRFP